MVSSFLRFLRLIIAQRGLVYSMAQRELASRHVGSFLGFFWTFVQPMITVAVFWFVFSVGFKSQPIQDVPFVVWLCAGLAPWFMFSEVVTGSAGAVVGNAQLIKKTLFPSQILPVIRIATGFVTHGVFLLVLLVLLVTQKIHLTFHALEAFYYLFALCFLVLGLSWIVSALNVFVRDVGHITGVFVQLLFWATPVFWDISIMPPRIQPFLKLNPVYYIVEGYRDAFVRGRSVADVDFTYTLYFWAFSILIFAVGATVFQRLKPHFADAL